MLLHFLLARQMFPQGGRLEIRLLVVEWDTRRPTILDGFFDLLAVVVLVSPINSSGPVSS